MRILLVAPFPVFPLTHGGSVRAHRLAVGLGQAGCAVEVLCPWYPGEPSHSFERDGVRWHPHRFLANLLPLILPERILPAAVALSLQPARLGPRRYLATLGEFDVVQFEFPWLFGWSKHLPGKPLRVLSAHNVEQDYVRDRVAPPGRAVAVARARAVEGSAVHGSNMVVTCTADDARRLTTLYGTPNRVEVVPNGFGKRLSEADRARARADVRRRLEISPEERVLVFLAGRAAHNLDALAAIESQVIPKLAGAWTLLVAGRVAKPGRSPDGSIRYLGHVDDIAPVLAAADVALNPVAAGSGSSVKVADYLAAGLPIVSTRVGARGFERFAESIMVAEIDGFAEAIESISIGSHRYSTALAELSTEAVGWRLRGAYEELDPGALRASSPAA